MFFQKPIIDPTVRVKVLSYPRLHDFREDFASKRRDDGSSDIPDGWRAHHEGLMKTLSRFGPVETHAAASKGFYHTRDCYNRYDDGVAIMNRKVLKKGLVQAIQEQLASYLDGAMFTLSGDTPLNRAIGEKHSIDGLEMLVTKNDFFIHWFDCTRDQCIQRIRDAGIQFVDTPM